MMVILLVAAVCEVYSPSLPAPERPPAHHYRLFGTTLASDLSFSVTKPWDYGIPGLTLRLAPIHPWLLNRPASQRLYSSPFHDKHGTSLGTLYRGPQGESLSFSKGGEFHFRPDRIDGYVPDQEKGLAELRFLGPVLSYWFELQGLLTLHASATAMNRHTVAFVSRHGGGKSGLAAAMVKAGASLLTDDLLVIEEREDRWEVRSSYPHMRMWPDEAEYFLGSYTDLPLVQSDSEKRSVAIGDGGFGSFHDASTSLSCIYLASRRKETDGGIEIQPVSRSEALIELVRHSFSARLVEAAGLQPARLDRLARLVRNVPVRRLVYPSGFERLPEVAENLLRSW